MTALREVKVHCPELLVKQRHRRVRPAFWNTQRDDFLRRWYGTAKVDPAALAVALGTYEREVFVRLKDLCLRKGSWIAPCRQRARKMSAVRVSSGSEATGTP